MMMGSEQAETCEWQMLPSCDVHRYGSSISTVVLHLLEAGERDPLV